ncbi:MAG: hypothetical protein ACM3VT_13730 [Solirubrobacterales bacterium]
MVDETRSGHPMAPRHHSPVPRRQIVLQMVVSAIILVSGIAIGSGGTILALRDRILPTFEVPEDNSTNNPPSEESRWTSGIAREIGTKYGLTDQQTQQVQDVLAQGFAATQELWKEFHKAEQTQQDKFALAMKNIMTPEQFTKWDTDFKQMAEHMRRMRPFDPRRGRGGPPGARGEWHPPGPPPGDRDPNAPRDGWRPGRFNDPNGPRGGWPRDRFGPMGDRPPQGPMDPNGPRRPHPPDIAEPNK